MAAREALVFRAGAYAAANLGDDDHVAAVASIVHPAAQNGFRFAAGMTLNPGGIHVGGIDEVAAQVCIGVEHGARGVLVGGPAEYIASQAQGRDPQVSFIQGT